MSFEPRDYLRHILVEADYLVAQTAGLTFDEFVANETLRRASDRTMKSTSKTLRTHRDELRPEYRFDYSKARRNRNRFASRMGANVVAVVLEPDVAQVFDSSDSVNQLLRSVISALPRRERRLRTVRRKAG